MEYPLVTVFTLIYNTDPRFIIEAIESVKKNNYPNLQHIIIDDASPNPVPKETVRKWIADTNYPCEFHEHTENYGICKTLNHVLELSKGKYLIGCSDDLLSDHRIHGDVALLEQLDESYGLVFGLAQFANAQSEPLPRVLPAVEVSPDDRYWKRLLHSNFLIASSVTFRTNLMKELKFNEKVKFEDYEIYLRLSALGYRFKCRAAITSLYRVHDTNISHSFDYALENVEILSLFADQPSVKELLYEKVWNMCFDKRPGYKKALAIYEKTFSSNTKLRITAGVNNSILLKVLVRLLKLARP